MGQKEAGEAMKFIVERTSKPCYEDQSIDVPEAHIEHTFHTPSGREWPVWVVDIADLDGLMAFVAKYGDVIISTGHWLKEPTPKLEIYDDCRE